MLASNAGICVSNNWFILIISKKYFGLFIIPIQYVCHNKVNIF